MFDFADTFNENMFETNNNQRNSNTNVPILSVKTILAPNDVTPQFIPKKEAVVSPALPEPTNEEISNPWCLSNFSNFGQLNVFQ